jgi:multicomponent Na+:H+ antiporter subunit B
MKWIYLLAAIALGVKILLTSNALPDLSQSTIVETIVRETGIPNAVSGIILRNRLYDTIFEVVVFTISILGVKFLLSTEQPATIVYQFTDSPSIVLARLGATIAALVSVELAIRGHLSPGGGFAAGVAGGTAIGLVAITSST